VRSVLAVAVLLAGCLGSPGHGDEPATYRWGLDGCRFVIAVIPVETAVAQRLVPAGFTPRPSSLAAVPGAPGAEVHADAYDCADGTALDGSRLDDVHYGSFYVPVDPPEELREPGYEAAFVKLDFLAWDPGALRTLRDGGLPAYAGTAIVVGTGNQIDAALSMQGGSGFRLMGAFGPAASQDGVLPFIEHTPLDGGAGGLATWHARLHDASFATGTGVLTVDGPMADVVGARVAVQFSTGTWHLDQADLAFPIAWP
jgi:hypothetical protein